MTLRFFHRRFLIVIALLALAVFAALPAVAQDDALQTACEEIWGDWNAETQRCESEVTYTIGIQYPIEFAAYDFMMEPVVALINNQRDGILGLRPFLDTPLDPAPGYSVNLNYESHAHSDNIVSLVYTVAYYTGGAHPNANYETFTFDLEAGRRLTFDDLFPPANQPLDVISPIAQAQLTEQQGEYADAEWIALGAGPDPVNFEDFALTEDSVIFYFEPYQVAAYAYGPSQVEIPLADLAGVMTPLS